MKFPNLPAASALTGSEIVPVTQGGVDVRTTTQDIADLGGGGGAEDFTDLGDVPSSYTGAGGQYVKVNVGETGLEFDSATPGAPEWGDITGTLSDQTDLQSALDAKAANRDVVSALATSGSVAVDAALGDYFTLALSGNVSGFTFSNLPGSGHGCTLAVKITQDSTPRTVGWPASFKWAGGSAPAVSTGSGVVDLLVITTFDNGTSWQADLAKGYA